MSTIKNILFRMKRKPENVRFKDLCKVRDHRIYRTPWPGDPRINIQNHKGNTKAYQVKQVLKAIEKLESENDITE